MLAHLAGTSEGGPALVIAPPAVVGNWAAEAARFTPDMRVVVHHGASRATAKQLAATIAKADVVITTYGTAVRDVEALAGHEWDRLVLDEAQAIKNPAPDATYCSAPNARTDRQSVVWGTRVTVRVDLGVRLIL